MIHSGNRFILTALITILGPHIECEATEGPKRDPMAVALLRGVELARTRHESVRATVDLNYSLPGGMHSGRCEIERQKDRLRSEVFPREGHIDAAVILREGTEFRGYRRAKHAHLDVYDEKRAASVRGDIAFDPRALGLSDSMSVGVTVKKCLWYDTADELSVIGREAIAGTSTWRIAAKRANSISEYWIEEPSFRVYRRTDSWKGTSIVINSEFNLPTVPEPFPSRVVAVRTDRTGRSERIYQVKSLELDVEMSADRFTLNSIGLPVNTMINDYRISRIVGYWDGEKVVPRPVSATASKEPQPAPRFVVWTVVALVLVTLGIATVVVRSLAWWRG